MKNRSLLRLTQGALIGALYAVLTYLSFALGLANGAIQFRLSEALCVLTCFTPIAIPALTVGCFLSNLLTGCLPMDIICGTAATLIGAIGGYCLRKFPYLTPLPTVISNVIVVPLVLKYTYGLEGGLLFFAFTVFVGELVTAYILGLGFYYALKPHEKRIFPK